MAACAHKGGRSCSCSAPESVSVKGYERGAGRRRRKPAGPKSGTRYYVATSSTGRVCEHKHRTRSGARACANRHQRAARAAHARLPKKAAKRTRVVRWDVDERRA